MKGKSEKKEEKAPSLHCRREGQNMATFAALHRNINEITFLSPTELFLGPSAALHPAVQTAQWPSAWKSERRLHCRSD